MNLFNRLILCAICSFPFGANADTIIRRSVFSTSTDWESVTGINLSQFAVQFSPDKKLIADGLELYFLDAFPCFGQTDSARIWIGPDGKFDRKIRITCLFPPKTVSFAWRNTKRNSSQDTTTGILECPVVSDGELKINLADCTHGKNWQDIQK